MGKMQALLSHKLSVCPASAVAGSGVFAVSVVSGGKRTRSAHHDTEVSGEHVPPVQAAKRSCSFQEGEEVTLTASATTLAASALFVADVADVAAAVPHETATATATATTATATIATTTHAASTAPADVPDVPAPSTSSVALAVDTAPALSLLLPHSLHVPRSACGKMPRGLYLDACVGVGTYGMVLAASELTPHGPMPAGVVKVFMSDGWGVRSGGWSPMSEEEGRVSVAQDDMRQSSSAASALLDLLGRDGVLGVHDTAKGEDDRIVPVTGVLRAGSDWRQWLMVMPYMPLCLAHPLIYRTRNPLPVARYLIQQVLRGVASLHARGVAHRDIKPTNVLLDASRPVGTVHSIQGIRPRVRVTDLGMSTTRLRCADHNVVTLHWRDPAISASLPYNPFKADVWAVGVMLRDAVTGTPFDRISRHNSDVESALCAAMARLGVPTVEEWPELHAKAVAEPEGPIQHAMDITAKTCPGHSALEGLWAPNEAGFRACVYGSAATTVPHNPQLDDLLSQMLALNPARRISVAEALTHPFFMQGDEDDGTEEVKAAEAVWLQLALRSERQASVAIALPTLPPRVESARLALEHSLLAGAFPPPTLATRYESATDPHEFASPLSASRVSRPTTTPRHWVPPAPEIEDSRRVARQTALRGVARACMRRGWTAATLLLATSMLDRALNRAPIPRTDVYVVAAAATFLASVVTVEHTDLRSLGTIVADMTASIGLSSTTLLQTATRQVVAELAATLGFSIFGGTGPLHTVSTYHALRHALHTHMGIGGDKEARHKELPGRALFLLVALLIEPELHVGIEQEAAPLARFAVSEAAAWIAGGAPSTLLQQLETRLHRPHGTASWYYTTTTPLSSPHATAGLLGLDSYKAIAIGLAPTLFL